MRDVNFEIRHYGGEARAHAHEHHQIVLPLQGALEMEIEGRADAVTDAKAALISARQRHSFQGASENAFLVVDLDPAAPTLDGRRDRFWEFATAAPFVALDRPLSGLCGYLSAAAEDGQLGGIQAGFAEALLIDALGRRMGLEPTPLPHALAEALAFIDHHIDQPISVARVAQAAGLSASRFHELFRLRFAMSPGRYILTQRLRRAASLLERTDRPLAAIALGAGYADQSAFTRAFRRDFGTTPARYRVAAREREKRHNVQ